MGQILAEILEDFGGGVNTSRDATGLQPNESPRGWNSALDYISEGKARVRKRKGLGIVTDAPVTGSPAIIGNYLFQPRSDQTLSQIPLAVTDSGRLEKVVAGVFSNLSTSLDATSPNPPDFETANNLCFIVNGTDKVKVTSDGTAVQNFGITRPASAPTIAATGVGVMDGTYEVAITYYNSVTGQESSLSEAASVTLASEQLRVTIPDTSAVDAQIDYVRVYIRETSLTTEFFRLVSGTGYSSTGGGWAEGYGTVDFNLSDTDLNNLIILAPSTTENNPPPDGVRYLAWHQSRMFAADAANLYYSKIGLPESFDPTKFEPINPDDGQLITGLHAVGGILVIFKTRSIIGLFGDDPNTWYLRQLDADTGCTSHRSIVSVEGTTYWWSDMGPIVWKDQGGVPFPTGKELLKTTIDVANLAATEFDNVVAAADINEQRVIFGVAESGQTRNTLMLPWSYRLNRWESTKWDPLDVASLGFCLDATLQPYIQVGSYAGKLYRLWEGDNDGVPSGTVTGTFTAGATSVTSLTDAGATFPTTDGGLVEVKVTIVDADGVYVGRRRITANTGTSLTFSALGGLTNGAVYTYYVGGPDFQWDTRWSTFDLPFHKKRFEFLFLQADSAASTTLTAELAFDWNPNYGQLKTFSLAGSSTTWNSDIWTEASYTTSGRRRHRVRVGRTGVAWKVRLRQPNADKPVVIDAIGVQAEQQTTKVG